MSVAFDQSQTRLNLMRAFAGESQARNRYVRPVAPGGRHLPRGAVP